jgi:predicted nuclease of restriction endonuclease-like (RecB) superfamily
MMNWRLHEKEMRKKGSALVKSNMSGVEQSYTAWIADLKRRYRATQIKAAVAVNFALIEFYWNLGKDISEKFAMEAKYGSRFFEKVSHDMRTEFPNDSGFSPRNIRYCQGFYRLYSATEIVQQVVAQLVSVPWGHHCTIIDKSKGDREKALFYVRRTIQNGWSRNSLLNLLSTDLYGREEYWRIPA